MTGFTTALFIQSRFVPNDGTRRVIADGHVERQDEEAGTSGYALLGELGAVLDQQGGSND